MKRSMKQVSSGVILWNNGEATEFRLWEKFRVSLVDFVVSLPTPTATAGGTEVARGLIGTLEFSISSPV